MKGKLINIKCDTCGKSFNKELSEYKRTKRHFCSKECSAIGRRGKNGTISKSKQVECSNCGTLIWKADWQLNRSEYLYCNKECMQEHRRDIGFYESDITYVDVNCAQCNKNFKINLSKYNGSLKRNPKCNFFCSDECNNTWRSINNRGENAYNWRGGITEITAHIRTCSLYLEWRQEVYKRDCWTCQECGYKGQDIEAHHKFTFAEIIAKYGIDNIEDALECEELWNIDNGMTLCKDCHKKKHLKRKVA